MTVKILAGKRGKNPMYFTIDEKHHHWVSKHNWYISNVGKGKIGYVKRDQIIDGKKKTFYLHREITNCPDDMHVDHINHDTLLNTESNLRICTNAENRRNISKRKGSESEFLGVHKHKPVTKKKMADGSIKTYTYKEGWTSALSVDDTTYHLGICDDEITAAKRYDLAKMYYHGEFSNLNFPIENYL